jgi:hypothetical protein
MSHLCDENFVKPFVLPFAERGAIQHSLASLKKRLHSSLSKQELALLALNLTRLFVTDTNFDHPYPGTQ